MAKRPGPKAECVRCHRTYRKCRRNAHNQKFCLHPDCVHARKQERQRKSYRAKYRSDKAFQQAERDRCGESLRARREASARRQEMSAAADGAEEPVLNWELVVLGMLGSLTDAEDPAAVQASLRHFERRGQRLAVFAPLARGAPRQQSGKNVPRQPFEAKSAVPRQPFEAKTRCSSTAIG